MNSNIFRPYIIIPKFIEQPTWGGDYIVKYKGWDEKSNVQGKKIGQSYELYGQSKVLVDINDSADLNWNAYFDEDEHIQATTLSLPELIKNDPEKILGKPVYEKFGGMTVLIKFTQAKGNSFQLHVKTGTPNTSWKPKPESWYYFEKGYLTFGIKKGIDIDAYKRTCIEIDTYMHHLSQQIKSGILTIPEAKNEAKKMVVQKNVWQYVNVLHVSKYSAIDLSPGGIHHSWEEDPDSELGNVLYEVQVDAKDEESTLRSFDQGKLKDDGSVRKLTIDEYFTYIDTSDSANDITKALTKPKGNSIFQTSWYNMDEIAISQTITLNTDDSFHHLFVRDGEIMVETFYGQVHLTRGHSCFIPNAVKSYTITPKKESVILKTYVRG